MPGANTIEIELDLGSSFTKTQALEFKDQLEAAIPGLNVTFKEYPPLPGQMSPGGIDWHLVVLYASVVATVEVSVEDAAEKIFEELKERWHAFWAKQKEKNAGVTDLQLNSAQSLGFSGTIKAGNGRKDFKSNSKGVLEEQYFEPYSINPEKTQVVLVGCSDYQNGIPSIPPAKNNLHDLYRLFNGKEYFGISRNNIHVSLNESSHDILNLLYTVSHTPGIETFIFYYVGHGFTTLHNDYALAAYNTKKTGDFINSGIDKKFIENQILESSPASQKILIIDACYSGLLTQGSMPQIFNNVKGTYILTSSNSDEVSLFDKDKQNTYFTTALIEVLQGGVPKETETISLQDLYEYTAEWLLKKKLPEPTCKPGLTISPAAFNICSNPAFSFDIQKERADQLIRQGKLSEASYIIKRLLKKQPHNKELKDLVLNVDTDRMFAELVMEGDQAFLGSHDAATALDKYRKALELKNDPLVKEKINACLQASDQNPKQPPVNATPLTDSRQPMGTAGETGDTKNTSKKKLTKTKKVILSLLVIFIAVFIGKSIEEFFLHKEPAGNTSEQQKENEEKGRKTGDSTLTNNDSTGKGANNTTAAEKERKPQLPANKDQDVKVPVLPAVTTEKVNEPVSDTDPLQLINGKTFESGNTTDKLTFIVISKNRVSFSGSINDYTVSGILKSKDNAGFTVVTSESTVTGQVVFLDNYSRAKGNFSIKKGIAGNNHDFDLLKNNQ